MALMAATIGLWIRLLVLLICSICLVNVIGQELEEDFEAMMVNEMFLLEKNVKPRTKRYAEESSPNDILSNLLQEDGLYLESHQTLNRYRRQTDNIEASGDDVDPSIQRAMFTTNAATDTRVIGDDAVSAPIVVETGIPYGNNRRYTRAYVGSNGVISFDRAFNGYSPRFNSRRPFICPYWTDINTRNGGSIYYRVFDANDLNDDGSTKVQLAEYNQEVNRYTRRNNFAGVWALIVTYDSVYPFQGLRAAADQEVTFQVLVITDGVQTYAFYLYQYNKMLWSGRNGRIFIGYNDINGFRRIIYSGNRGAYKIDRYKGNTGFNGYWVFKVGEAPSPQQLCLNWYFNNRNDFSTRRRLQRLPRCSCNRFRMFFDWRWRFTRRSGFTTCFTLLPLFRTFPASRECCYRGNSLIRRRPQQGSSFKWHPRFRRQHYREDTLPKQHCCIQSSRFCRLYYQLRPPGGCSFSFFFFFAFLFGDPHVTTLDDVTYTFNGHGEYVLIDLTDSDNSTFMLQGRTTPAITVNGTVTNATVFSAFAASDSNGGSFQVELNNNKTGMNVLANGRDYTSQIKADPSLTTVGEEGQVSLNANGSSITGIFSLGMSLTVTMGTNILTIAITMPSEFANSTRGLMGNFNSDKTDEFIKPDGTMISPNSSEEEIFNYGQLWQVNVSESVFTYPTRKTAADFAFPNFIPLFLDQQSEALQQEAFTVCGGRTNLACVYDFLATGSEDVAAATRTSSDSSQGQINDNANTSPEISGPEVINATVNEPVYIAINGSDAEDLDNVMYTVVSQPNSSFTFNETARVATWTPTNTDAVDIAFSVADSKGIESPQLDVEVRLCDGCGGNGVCNHETLRETQPEDASLTFQLVTCDCNVGWAGDSCTVDEDACSNDPCLNGQNCTDLAPQQQAADPNQVGFNCTECPTGFLADVAAGKCNDIDECNSTHLCDQICLNTEGSYMCSCNSGYRKTGFGTCEDINECSERTSGCNQLCDNLPGSFNCSCRPGYNLQADNTSCIAEPNNACDSSNCTQGCVGSAGDVQCFCFSGYSLNADNITCDNVNECERNPKPCTQICNDTVGNFECKCHIGFTLAVDNVACDACDDFQYGENCAQTCDCSENSLRCDSVKGCVCTAGWKGEQCLTDINECNDGTFTCPDNTICENTDGSYECQCQAGYNKVNNTCQDIDECANPDLENCEDNTQCENSNGSFVCTCLPGYKRQSDINCTDIDECTDNTHRCQQECENNVGSYNCKCEFGFALDDDRFSCERVADVCAKFANLNCSYACNVSLSGETANCYCESGYRLAADQQTCFDINECASNLTNQCSERCSNQLGTYTCACSIGKKLENDGRTCSVCDSSHWGENCANECACGIGASECNAVTGCVCQAGWQGEKCDQDKDECSTVGICPTLSTCRNTPGNYSCVCRDGYKLSAANVCEDVNECSNNDLNNCDSICTNSVGSFVCSCFDGFLLKDGSCQDIDECTTSKDNCEQVCKNEAGSFRCECRNGFTISDNMANKCIKTNDAGTTCTMLNCTDNQCEVKNGQETCFCLKGFKLGTDNTSCTNIDECNPNPCGDNCTDSSTPGQFSCACTQPGFQLDTDDIGCKECSEGSYGVGCSDNCTCTAQNTLSCDKKNGTCYCRNGWEGAACETDINECDQGTVTCGANSTCQNTDGSAICVCDVGFFKSGQTCVGCDDRHFGSNCAEDCLCVAANTIACDKIQGNCTCKSTWKGTTCSTDVDECQLNSTICGGPEFTCNNFDGGFQCVCSPGFQKNSAGACIDDCQVSNGGCAQVCASGPPVVNGKCSCRMGYSTTNNGATCDDNNECETNNGGCDHNCTNTDGSFTCSCRSGFTLNSDNLMCTDNNECETNNGGCDHNCTNTNGSFICSCNPGYQLNDDNLMCIDECDIMNGGCAQVCASGPPGVNGKCSCRIGYNTTNNGTTCDDINECDTNNGGCDQTCTNTNGSFICSCNSGYQLNNDNLTCSDINECDTNDGGCDHNCTNTNGSFICSCNPGFVLNNDNLNCTDECDIMNGGCAQDCASGPPGANGKCSCRDGYNTTNNGTTCDDINECFTNNGGCNQTCNNTDGSFKCSCNQGFELNSDNLTCKDLGPCGINNGGCEQTCSESGGNVTCGCESGYMLNSDNITCSDINECTTNRGGCEFMCKNLNGTYLCSCDTGFQLAADNHTCEDINECVVDVNKCNYRPNSECMNTVGGSVCVCKSGFNKTGVTCTDIDECATNRGGCSYDCSNLNGTYLCTCQTGYEVGADNKTCQDINECLPTSPCNVKPKKTICSNTPGNYLCLCVDGYELNAATDCVDINECTENKDNCEDVCGNLPGSFNCSCSGDNLLNTDNRTCSAQKLVSMSLTLDDPFNKSAELENKSSPKYAIFKTDMELTLFKLFSQAIAELIRVIIKDLRKGSIIADYDLVLRLSSGGSQASASGISAIVQNLTAGQPLVIGSTSFKLNNISIGNVQLNNLETCAIFSIANGTCPTGQECYDNSSTPACRVIPQDEDDDIDLIIGLGVGIPIFFMVAVVIAILIYIKCKRTSEKATLVNGHETGSNGAHPFGRSVPLRSKHGPSMYLPYTPDGLSVASSSSDGGTKKTKKRKGRDDFQDSAWFDSPGAFPQDQIESNFSWDYLYRMLQPERQFEIRRPQVNGSANPALSRTTGNRNSAA